MPKNEEASNRYENFKAWNDAEPDAILALFDEFRAANRRIVPDSGGKTPRVKGGTPKVSGVGKAGAKDGRGKTHSRPKAGGTESGKPRVSGLVSKAADELGASRFFAAWRAVFPRELYPTVTLRGDSNVAGKSGPQRGGGKVLGKGESGKTHSRPNAGGKAVGEGVSGVGQTAADEFGASRFFARWRAENPWEAYPGVTRKGDAEIRGNDGKPKSGKQVSKDSSGSKPAVVAPEEVADDTPVEQVSEGHRQFSLEGHAIPQTNR